MPATKRCYFHGVQDPNEERYDPAKHSVCVVCCVKLWELAQNGGVEFDCRGQIISIGAEQAPPGHIPREPTFRGKHPPKRSRTTE